MLAQKRCKVLGASPQEAQVESSMVSEQTITYALEASKAHCAAIAKAACAASPSYACGRQAFHDIAVCCTCAGYGWISKGFSRAKKKSIFTSDHHKHVP